MSGQRVVEDGGAHTAGDELRQRLLAGAPIRQRRLRLAGVSTAVLEGGSGPPVVLLHGQGWLGGRLAAGHRRAGPHPPGGRARPAGPRRLAGGRGPARGRDRPGLAGRARRPDLRGPAGGGRGLAGRLARRPLRGRPRRPSRRPDPGRRGRSRWQGADPAGDPAGAGPPRRPAERTQRHGDAAAGVGRPGTPTAADGERWAPFRAYSLELSRTPSVQRANRQLLRELGLRQIPPEDLARIDQPVTLIWGRQDRVMPLAAAQEASARYGWPLEVIDHAGHILAADQPEAFLRALQAALARP